MSTTVTCPNCQAQLSYRGTAGSQTKPCPKCGTAIAFVIMDAAPIAASDSRAEAVATPQEPAPAETAVAAGPPIRIELPKAETAPQAVVPDAAPRPKSNSSAMILIPVGVGCAAVTLSLCMCGGLAVFFTSVSGDSASGEVYGSSEFEYEPQTVYSPPAHEPWTTETPTTDYGYTSETPAYDGSTVSDPYPPTDYATAPADYSTPEPVTGLWNFDGLDRVAELEVAIQEDQARADELEGQMVLTGGFGWISGIVSDKGETADDRISGEIGEQGANYVYSELQKELAAVQARLDANRAELARLQAGS